MATYQEAVLHMEKGYSAELGWLYRIKKGRIETFDRWWQPAVLELSQITSNEWRLGGV